MKVLRSILAFALIFVALSNNTYAAVNAQSYPFTSGSAAPEDMTGSTGLLTAGNLDDDASAVTPIGFTFNFDGTAYTQFSVNANGLMRLGPVAVSTVFSNSLSTATDNPKIAPLFEDMCTSSAAGGGTVNYKMVGSPGSRKLIVEWKNMKFRSTTCSSVADNTMTFQAWLTEGSDRIDFVYATFGTVAPASYSVGLAGGVGNFASVTAAAAPTVSYATANNTNTFVIPNNTQYSFIPPATPIVSLSSATYSVAENVGNATIALTRAGVVTAASTVDVVTSDGTATSPADYTGGTYTATFEAGSPTATVNIPVISDSADDSGETFNVTLQNPTGATVGTPSSAVITIIDPFAGGTYTVGTGGTYTSLTNAGGIFAAINSRGSATGPVTIEITSDLTAESGATVLNAVGGGFPITIKPSGAARVISGSSATNTGLITLNGADNVTIDGSLSGATDRSLTITNNQTGTSTVVWIRSQNASNGASNNTIKNCIINGAATSTAQTTAGILAGSGVTIGGAAEAPNNGNKVINNQIYRVQNAIYNQGNVGLDQGWEVTDNQFGSATEADTNRFRGMLMGNANNFVIANNEVLGVTSFSGTGSAMSGIQLAFGVSNGVVANNKITNIRNISGAGTGAYGFQLSAAPVANVLIANNFVSDIHQVATTSALVTSNGHGININGAAPTGAYKVYHNTINMNLDQTSGTTSALHVASAVVAAGAIDLRNNILANTQTTGATRFAVFSAAPVSVFSNINYNDYFAPNVGSIGGATRVTLADWQVATASDANSIAGDPLFVSSSDFHITMASPARNSGTVLLDVPFDFDGEARPNVGDPPATSDMGADEFYGGSVVEYSISGQVTMADGRRVARAIVTLTGGSLTEPRMAMTNTFGRFAFRGLPSGATYTLTIDGKRYTFTPPTQTITLNGDVSNADFTVIE